MKHLKTAGLWYVLLNKRFLKKYIFTVLLLLIPLLTLAVRSLGREDGGVLHVLLCQENGDPEGSDGIIQELLQKNGVIHYEFMNDQEEARAMVRRGKADSMWTFPEDMQQALQNYLEDTKPVVAVYVREDTVQTKLVREQLYGVLYSRLSLETTRLFIQEQPMFSYLSEEEKDREIETLYEENAVPGSIFQFSYLDHTDIDTDQVQYLTAPLRGIVALVLLLAAMAAAMFWIQDRDEQIFSWMPVGRKRWFPLFYIGIAVLDAALVCLLALYLSGTFTTWVVEIPLMTLYAVSVTGFANLLQKLTGNLKRMGAVVPVILLVSFVLCPVFLNIRTVPLLQHLLPAYYYLNSLHNGSMVLKFAVYTALVCLLGTYGDFKKY